MSTPPPQGPRPFEGPDEGIGYPLDVPLQPPTSTHDAGSEVAPSSSANAPVSLPPPAHLPVRRGVSRQQVMALTPILATIAFFVCGFAFGGWAWAWLFWLAVPVVGIITRDEH